MASTNHLQDSSDRVTTGARVAVLLYSTSAYALGVAALLWLVASLAGLTPFTGGPLPGLSLAGALAVDFGLLVLFALQHSIMARPAFKQRLTRWLPAAAERSTYVLAAGLFLGLLVWFWQPMAVQIWYVEHPGWQQALWGLFAFGWLYLLAATYVTDHYDLFGLRQAWFYFRGQAYRPVPFVRTWMYRYSRHPMMAGILIGLWATPQMRADHLILAAGLTLYILVGLAFEERQLLRDFGEQYRHYRRRVAALVPWRAVHWRALLRGS